ALNPNLSLLPPDAAAGTARLFLGLVQPVRRVRRRPAGAVQHDRFAEIVFAELAAVFRRAAIHRLTRDLPSPDITIEIVHFLPALALDAAQMHRRAVEDERRGIEDPRYAAQRLRRRLCQGCR